MSTRKVWWRHLEEFSQNHRWLLVLVFLLVWIALANFQPKAWLTGWDTLHPEFNFELNLGRMIDGAWRSDQGLGAVAAHAHMSDLPRVLVMWLLHLVLPLNTVKFVFVLLCLILGPVGVYAFVYANAPKQTNSLLSRDFVAFVGGLLYLCNLGTVQHFYVIFEMFAVQFAAIGWLFFVGFQYLTVPNRRLLALFAFLGFLSSPMAYASTLWLALFAGFLLALGGYIMLSRNKQKLAVNATIMLATWIAVSLFWLLPNAYFLLSTASSQVSTSHINELFSPEVFYHNQAFGNWRDFPLLRSFLFNWASFDFTNGTYSQLLQPWIIHLERPLVSLAGYLMFILAGLGLASSLKRKSAVLIAFIPVAALTSFMLLNENPPLGWLFSFLRENFPLFEEGFRTPFTKFSILHMFVMALFGAVGAQAIAHWLSQVPRSVQERASTSLMAGIILLNVWFFWPAFQGNLIAPKMKWDIPQEYFSLFEYARTLPTSARIAQLPLHTYAGWDYTNWGYEGPGFAWFNLKQPLLVRDFDRWNPGNEDFYNQAAQALYNEDVEAFASVLRRYEVSYLFVDGTIITPGRRESPSDVALELLAAAKAPRVWEQNDLALYDVRGFATPFAVAESIAGRASYARLSPQEYGTLTSPGFYELSTSATSPNTLLPFHFLTQDRPFPAANRTVWKSDLLSTSQSTALSSEDIYLLRQPDDVQLTTSVVFTYKDDQLLAKFAHQPVLSVNDATQILLPEVLDLTAPVVSTPAAVVVGVNGVFTKVEQNEISRPVIFSYSRELPPVIHYGPFVEGIPLEENVSRSAMEQVIATLSEAQQQVALVGNAPESLGFTPASDSVHILPFSDFESSNCDLFRRGQVSTSVLINSLEQIATDRGAICSSTTLQSGAPGDGLLIRLRGVNHEGRSVKAYLRNALTGRSEVEQLLPQGEFDTYFTVMNGKQWLATQETLYPYSLTLETRSFGQDSRNTIHSVEVSPLSTSYLAALRLEKSDQRSSLPVLTAGMTRIGHSRYQALVEQPNTDSLLSLSQAYDPGWLAFPTIQFWKPLQHIRYNGWANGWIVPGTCLSDSECTTQTITLLYWPQLFSFLGYTVLFIALIVIGWSALGEWRFLRNLEKQIIQDPKARRSLEKLRRLLEGKR